MAKKAGVVTIDFNAGTLSLLRELDTANTKLKQFGKNAESSGFSFRYAFNGVKDIMEGRVNNAVAEAANELLRLRGAALAAGGAALGIVALGVAAYEAKKFFKELREEQEKLQLAFRQISAPLQAANDEIRVANDRLVNDIARLQGHQQNTLKLALDEARVAADQLAESLDKDLAALEKLLHEQNLGALKAMISGQRSTAGDEEGIKRFRVQLMDAMRAGNDAIRAAKSTQEKDSAESRRNAELARLYNEELDRRNVLLRDAERLQRIHEGKEKGPVRPGINEAPIGAVDQAQFIAEQKLTIDQLRSEQDKIGLLTDSERLKGQKAGLESAKEYAQKQEQALKSAYDAMLADLEASESLTAHEKLEFRQNELREITQNNQKLVELQRDVRREIGQLTQEDFAAGKAMRDKEEKQELDFKQRMTEIETEWAKRAYEATASMYKRLTERSTEPRPDIPQTPIAGNDRTRLQGTAIGRQLAARDAGFATIQQQQEAIDNEKRLLTAMEQGGYSLAQQLAVRDRILQMEIALRREQTAEAEQDQILRDMVQERLQIGTLRAGMQAFFLEMQQQAKKPGQILFEGMNSALDRLSENITQFVTGGKTQFGQMFKDIGRQMVYESVKSELQKGLGALGRHLGINVGMRLDGQTEAGATWVRIAGDRTGGGAQRGIADALGKIFGRKGGIFSGSLGGGVFNFAGTGGLGGGKPDGTELNPFYVIPEGGGSQPSTAASGWASVFQNLGLAVSSGGLKIGGARASGGDVSPDKAYTVAENGFEILAGASGHVFSNAESRNMLGSGETHNYFINAAPGVSREEMFQAVTAAHRASVSTSVQANVEFTKRRPSR